jgi:hypothetical protein
MSRDDRELYSQDAPKFPRFHQLAVGEFFRFKRTSRGSGLMKIEPEQSGRKTVNASFGREKVYVRPNVPTIPEN